MVTTTARSKRYFEKQGFIVAHVEKFNHYTMRRIDVFGFGDLLVCEPDFGIALVQCTTMGHLAEREAKIRDEYRTYTFLESGGRILLHGWAKKGPRGKRKTWQLTEREIK